MLLLTSCHNSSFTACSMVCFHFSLYYTKLHPHFHVFTVTHTYIHAHRGTLDQKLSVRQPGYLVENSCPLLSLPLTPAWQQPEIWGLPRPLSWEKRTGQHIHSEKLLSLLSLSLACSDIQRRKKAICLCSFTHSATNRNLRFTYTLSQPHSQNH